ncbi:MAG: hypothetical protein AAFY52_08035 [Pseudomonadota bacterium]
MPRTAAELIAKHGKHTNPDDGAKDGLFWRTGKWGAENKHGYLVDADGAFFDLAAGSKIHIHVYRERDANLVQGHVKNAKGKKMQFKNEAGCVAQMRAAGFSDAQITYVKKTMYPEFNAALLKKPAGAGAGASAAAAAPTEAQKQEAARLAYHAHTVKLKKHTQYDNYVTVYGEPPNTEADLTEFSDQIKSGQIDMADYTDDSADSKDA